MNTAQTYTGKTTPANPIVDRHYQALHKHVDNFAQEREASADIESMADLLMGYLSQEIGYDAHAPVVNSSRRYELQAHHIDRIYTTLRLMVSVTEIKEQWAVIERFEQPAPVSTTIPSVPGKVVAVDPQPPRASISVTPDRGVEQWRVKFLTDALSDGSGAETLFWLLRHAWEMHTSIDPTAAITKLLDKFTQNPANDLNDTENRQLIRDVTGHIAAVNELNSCFFCFDTTTGYINIATDHEK